MARVGLPLLLVLYLAGSSFGGLRCDLSAWDTETLQCFPVGNRGNHISHKRRISNYVDTILIQSFEKFNWKNIKTFSLRNTNLLSISPELFLNAEELRNLDLSENPKLCFEGNEFMHLAKLQTLRLSGSGRCTDSSILNHVPNLYSLDLSNLRFKSKIFSLRNLNSFTGLQIIDLSNNEEIDFTMFNIGDSVRQLNASGTRVTLGTKCFVSAGSLKTILMSHSQIMHIPKDTFVGTQVNTADLSYNSISFNSLPNLAESMTHINLSHNLINDIYTSQIFGERLEVLDLSYNNISHLHLDTFEYASRLTYLNLGHNRLFWLFEKLLYGATSLKWLDLSYNSIGSFYDGFFVELENLETLNLAGNLFYSLDSALFQGNVHLKHVYLQDNQLYSVNILTFAHLRELESLDLRSNLLKRVPEELLHVGRLQRVALSCNRLSFLGAGALRAGHGLRVALHGNPWKCGCLFAALAALRGASLDAEFFSEGNYPTCYVGSSSYDQCDDNSLTEDDYANWAYAVKNSGIKC